MSILIFNAIVRYFPVFGDNQDSHNYTKTISPEEENPSLAMPSQWGFQSLHRTSLIVVIGVAMTAGILPSVAVQGRRIMASPVKPSIDRTFFTNEGEYIYKEAPAVFTLNGDGAGKDVKDFPHQQLIDLLGGDESCAKCHCGEAQGIAIQSKKDYRACALCHNDMYKLHPKTKAIGLKEAYHSRCIQCHDQEGVTRGKPNMSECIYCHR